MTKIVMYKKIYEDILNKISDGTYAKGDMLPSEIALAKKYNVSRITTNKAMGMLAEQGIVQRISGTGTFILGKGEEKDNDLSFNKSSSKDNIIGVIVDKIGAGYGLTMMLGIERYCQKNDFNMLFYCTYGSEDEETKAIERALTVGVKGLILMCVQGETYNRCILNLVLQKFPVVFVDREMQGLDIPCVKTDNYAAAMELTEKLIEKGHEKICFVTHGAKNTTTVLERYHGFLNCIATYPNVQSRFQVVNSYKTTPFINEEDTEYEEKEIERIVTEEKDCTAFFVVEYKMAVIFESYFNNNHIKKDIVTFDGMESFVADRHSFIQIVQDEYTIGGKAAEILIEKINGKTAGAEASVMIPYRIKEE